MESEIIDKEGQINSFLREYALEIDSQKFVSEIQSKKQQKKATKEPDILLYLLKNCELSTTSPGSIHLHHMVTA